MNLKRAKALRRIARRVAPAGAKLRGYTIEGSTAHRRGHVVVDPATVRGVYRRLKAGL